MGSAFSCADVIDKGKKSLRVTIKILEGDFNDDLIFFTINMNNSKQAIYEACFTYIAKRYLKR